MDGSRLVFVEGIMGSGKSTLARFLAGQLRRSGRPTSGFVETRRGRDNPTDVLRSVRESSDAAADVWKALSAPDLRRRSERRWEDFVEAMGAGRRVAVFDGQLLGGDFTGLFLMDESPAALEDYLRRLLEIVRPLRPALVYIRHSRPDAVLRRIGERRGPAWLDFQVGWKVASPYCVARDLRGAEGWIELYRRYQRLTDRIVGRLDIPVLEVTDPGRDWERFYGGTLGFLDLQRHPDPGFRLWWWTKRARLGVFRAFRLAA